MKSVSLELWDQDYAGGKEIFIEIVQANRSCHVKKVARINRGETKKWSTRRDLGTCFGTSFDIDAPGIKFRLRTTHSDWIRHNDFKPKVFTIIIGRTVFKSDEMNGWVDANKGRWLRNAARIKGISYNFVYFV